MGTPGGWRGGRGSRAPYIHMWSLPGVSHHKICNKRNWIFVTSACSSEYMDLGEILYYSSYVFEIPIVIASVAMCQRRRRRRHAAVGSSGRRLNPDRPRFKFSMPFGSSIPSSKVGRSVGRLWKRLPPHHCVFESGLDLPSCSP